MSSLRATLFVRSSIWVLGLVCVVMLVHTAPAQQLAKRLILKDGTYQLASKWEIKGDRVRYLSAERDEWEELPESLVDWPATSKFEQDRAAGVPSPEAIELDKELAAERAEEEAKTPLVAPDLRLPENGSLFLLDTFQNQPQLLELPQNGGELNRNRAQNMIRAAVIPIPITSSKQTIEIEGSHATVQAHATLPSIYVNLASELPPPDASRASSSESKRPQQPEQAQQPWDRFHIVRVQVKKGKRVVGVIKISPLGKATQQQNLVETTCRQISGGWVQVTPTAALEPGEYAVIELLGREGMNTYVWDFGVNPAVPANPNPIAAKPPAKKP